MSNYKLISVGDDNAKLAKSADFGYLSAGISLAPDNTSGYPVCGFSGLCANDCVAHANNGRFRSVQEGRIRRTRQFFDQRDAFFADLRADLRKVAGVTRALRLKLHFRANVFSDLNWRAYHHSEGWGLFDLVEEIGQCVPVVVADYTKDFRRALAELHGTHRVQWHNVFSRSETNESDCLRVLRAGGRVAVPFAVKPSEQLPKYWKGHSVVDGDVHDLTFLHPARSVIGLRAKGSLRNSDSPFVVDCGEQLFNDRLYTLV